MTSWHGEQSANQPKRSWKKKGGTPAASPNTKYWNRGGGRRPIVSGRAIKFFLASTVLLASAAFLVLQLWRRDLPTPIISVAATEYAEPWVPNAWAVEDQKRFSTILNPSSEFIVSVKNEKTHGTWQEILRQELSQSTPGGPGGSLLPRLFGYRALIVHLSAHGVTNGEGQPCLLFSDADPLDDTTWVPLALVLKEIREFEDWEAHPPKTLLILDSGKQMPDFRCGLFVNGFADAARELVQSLHYDDFALLLACDDQQLAWTAPEIGGSVFGFMVASGLRGLADSDKVGGDNNQRLTVNELHHFVSCCVQGYVQEHRRQCQTPLLLWCGEADDSEVPQRDFELASVVDSSSEVSSSFEPNDNLQRIQAAWQSFGRWNDKASSLDSWPRAEAVSRLARAEQLLWAGAHYREAFQSEIQLAQRAQRSVPEAPWASGVCGGSIELFQPNLARSVPFSETRPPEDSLGTRSTSSSSVSERNEAGQEDNGNVADDVDEVSENDSANAQDMDGTRMDSFMAWLASDDLDDQPAPSSERPPKSERYRDVLMLVELFSQQANALTRAHLDKALKWLGDPDSPRLLSREEALLRTIRDHLQLTTEWDIEAKRKLGALWAKYLVASTACEQALAIQDPRITHQLEQLASQLLVSQRNTRDIIHGCETAIDLDTCIQHIESMQRLAESMEERRKSLENAWQLHDRMTLELPTAAAWAASPLIDLQPLSGDAVWATSEQLLVQLRQLTQQLEAGELPTSEDLASTEAALNRLTSAASQAWYELVSVRAAGQPKELGYMMLGLGLRPCVGDGFQAQARGQLHRDLEGRFLDLREQNTVAVSRLRDYCRAPAATHHEAVAIWSSDALPREPTAQLAPLFVTGKLLGELQEPPGTGETGSRLFWCLTGRHLRQALMGRPEQLVDEATDAVSNLPQDQQNQALVDETRLLQLTDEAQVIGPLVPTSSFSGRITPAEYLRSVCWQKYALWQAIRSLNDFWLTPRLTQGPERDFMSASSADWIAKASRMQLASEIPLARAREKQAEYSQLSSSWQTAIDSVDIQPNSLNGLTCKLALSSFPNGWGWLRLDQHRDSQRPAFLDDSGRTRIQHRLEIGASAATETTFEATVADLPAGSHEIVAWFRGHQSRSPLQVNTVKPPLTLAWNVDPPQETTIRINANPQPARIAFVLDCSGSMGRNLEVAKNNLLQAILALPPERTEICLLAFGHSTRYGSNLADQYAPKWKAYRAQPNPRRPYNDVELLLPLTPLANPLGQLDPNVERRLQKDLEQLSSWGDTPLYEALLQANELLKADDGFRGIRKIVAITDGKNSVTPDLPQDKQPIGKLVVDPQFLHSLQSVKQKLPSNVVVDVIAFNFSGVPDELEDLARVTGGSTYFANNKNLGAQLRLSLFPGRFSTFQLPGGQVIGKAVPLFDKQDIAEQMLPGSFEVTIDGTSFDQQVSLLGGEAIELRYNRGAGLVFEKYNEGDQQADKQSQITNVEGHTYSAMMLTGLPRTQPQVRMCLQAGEAIQSRRPERFLLEMRLGRPGEQGGPTLAWTSDAQWESRHRTPVLRVPMGNLPDLDNGFLEARLWLPGTQAEPSVFKDLPLARLREQKVDLGAGITARGDFQIQNRQLVVTITEERLNQDSRRYLTEWKISPVPDVHIAHRFFQTKLEHEFIYADPTLLDRLRLTATVVDTNEEAGWNASQWIRVP